MATILQMTFSGSLYNLKIVQFWIKFHWSLFLRFLLTVLVQIMAWCQKGNKPLPPPMMRYKLQYYNPFKHCQNIYKTLFQETCMTSLNNINRNKIESFDMTYIILKQSSCLESFDINHITVKQGPCLYTSYQIYNDLQKYLTFDNVIGYSWLF